MDLGQDTRLEIGSKQRPALNDHGEVAGKCGYQALWDRFKYAPDPTGQKYLSYGTVIWRLFSYLVPWWAEVGVPLQYLHLLPFTIAVAVRPL